MNLKVRLVKLMSHSGFCSRRNAEKIIKDGEVRLNGNIFLGHTVEIKNISKLTIKGKQIKIEKPRVWFLNKGIGLICSNSNQYNKKNIFDVLPKNLPRLVSVGRLDLESQGLLLLTNNPTLSNFLEHPKNKIKRKYQVKVSGLITKKKIDTMERGVTVDEINYQPMQIKLINAEKNSLLEITLQEGKNREIRKIMKNFDLKVIKLKRIEFGPFKLLNLNENKITEVPLKVLKEKLKIIGFKYESDIWSS